MNKKNIAIIAFFANLVAIQSAFSAWHGAEWGMSPEKFQTKFNLPINKANQKQIKNYSHSGLGSLLYVFNYNFKIFKFSGSIFFKNDKLSMIDLSSYQPNGCDSVFNYLSDSYGKPVYIQLSENNILINLPEWQDLKGKNIYIVNYISAINLCDIKISNLHHSNNSM